MSNKLLAGLLVGATLLATSLTAPAQARDNNLQNLLNAQAMQAYQQNVMNQQYGYNPYGYGYGYDPGNGIGAPGINPNDPNAFKEAQYRQWLSTQGGYANRGVMNTYPNRGVVNSQFYGHGMNNGWTNRFYRSHH